MRWPFSRRQAATKAFSVADLEMVSAAERAVASFANYLGDDAMIGELRDEAALPGPKGALVNAFVVALAVEADPERRDALLQYGLLLSQFQPSVGDKPLRQMPDISQANDDELLSAVLAHKPEFDRFSEVFPTAIAEAKKMAEKYQQAIDAASLRNAR